MNQLSNEQLYSLFSVKVKFLDTKAKTPTDVPDNSGWQPFHSWKQERYEENNKPICDHQTAYKRMKRLIEYGLYSPYRTALLYLNVTEDGNFCKSKDDKGIQLKKFVYGRASNSIRGKLDITETNAGIILRSVQIETYEGQVLKKSILVNINPKQMDEHIQMNYVFWKKQMEQHFYNQKKEFNETKYLQSKAF